MSLLSIYYISLLISIVYVYVHGVQSNPSFYFSSNWLYISCFESPQYHQVKSIVACNIKQWIASEYMPFVLFIIWYLPLVGYNSQFGCTLLLLLVGALLLLDMHNNSLLCCCHCILGFCFALDFLQTSKTKIQSICMSLNVACVILNKLNWEASRYNFMAFMSSVVQLWSNRIPKPFLHLRLTLYMS